MAFYFSFLKWLAQLALSLTHSWADLYVQHSVFYGNKTFRQKFSCLCTIDHVNSYYRCR